MTYADYTYYKNTYKGSLSEPLFDFYLIKASKMIDRNVNRKIKETDIDNNFKDVACELCDFLQKYDTSNNKEISSYSIDGVSKTFKTYTKEEYKTTVSNILDNLPHDLRRYL